MTDESASAANVTEPVATLPPSADSGSGAAAAVSARIEEKPELAVGGAFAGGLVLGLILKRIAR